MPIYVYAYTDDIDISTGAERPTVELYQSMDEPHYTHHPDNGRPIRRVVQCPHVQGNYGEGNGCKPIEMMSIALDNEDEIAAFRQRNPGTEISDRRGDPLFGVPVVKSRGEKLRVLDKEGFQETN